MLTLLLALTAHAADEPCYGHRWSDRVEGDHVWVEWQPGFVTDNGARAVLGIVEDAWTTYDDEGWRMPPPEVVVSLQNPILGDAGARCTTEACGEDQVPIIEVYPGGVSFGASKYVPPHELGHAVQYQYMGAWTDSVRSWEWWMEGCATWMETHSAPDTDDWAIQVAGYNQRPQLALHHGATGLFDLDVLPHLYGTAGLALYTEERWGGVEAVQQTWEIGAASSGDPIWFPDVVDQMGIDWDTYWDAWLATIAVDDFERGDEIPVVTRTVREVRALPAHATTVPPEDLPQSLGFNVIRFTAGGGQDNRALYVELTGDPGPKWHAVLVLAAGGDALSKAVQDEVSLQRRDDGTMFGWMSGFDGHHDAYLVVSPEVTGEDPDGEHPAFAYTWTAELVRDPGPMEPGDTLRGCAHAPGAGWLGLAVALLGARRRRR